MLRATALIALVSVVEMEVALQAAVVEEAYQKNYILCRRIVSHLSWPLFISALGVQIIIFFFFFFSLKSIDLLFFKMSEK